MTIHIFSRFLLIFFCLFISVSAQNLKFERDRHKSMLKNIKNDIEKHYYDPDLRGIDIEKNYKEALEKLDQAASIGQMNGIIAQFMIDFDDSHLFFSPPGKVNKTDYGFEMRMVGDKCFVYSIDEKSDAAKKGLQIGDQIFAIEGYGPSRENFWKLNYLFYRLRPQLAVNLAVIKPDGKEIIYQVNAHVKSGKKIMDLTGADINEYIRESEDAYRQSTKQYFYDAIDGVFVWKMPSFSLDPSKVDDIMNRAKKPQNMILDLRGNGGGRVDMVLRLIGNFFPEEIKVGDEKERKKTKEVLAKSRGNNSYTGKIVVLIDHDSGSASEVFSKVIQLEKRGIVIGDQSAGAVMKSRYFGHRTGIDIVAFYGASITIADLVMKDGKSLEKIGVIPDEILLPTAQDLANRRDPVLSRAFEILGFKVSAEDAGKIFPVEYEN